MNTLNNKGLLALTVAEEQKEIMNLLRSVQRVKLRAERPQNDFRGGWLSMWTIVSDFYDSSGYNRNGGTFTSDGLKGLGIVGHQYRDPRGQIKCSLAEDSCR